MITFWTGRKRGEGCSMRKRASISPSNKVLPPQVRQIRKWLWEEYKYQTLQNINTLELQYKALWSGLVISATCTRHALGELIGILWRLKKSYSLQQLKKFTLEMFTRSWNMHGPFDLERWPDSKAEIAAALILPESRCKSRVQPLPKVKSLTHFFHRNQFFEWTYFSHVGRKRVKVWFGVERNWILFSFMIERINEKNPDKKASFKICFGPKALNLALSFVDV